MWELYELNIFLLAQTPQGTASGWRIAGVNVHCSHESLLHSHIKDLQNHLQKGSSLICAQQATDFHLLILASCLPCLVNKRHFFYNEVPTFELKPFC